MPWDQEKIILQYIKGQDVMCRDKVCSIQNRYDAFETENK